MNLTQTASDVFMLPFQMAFFFMAAPFRMARWGVKTGRQGASYLLDSFPDAKQFLPSQTTKLLGATKAGSPKQVESSEVEEKKEVVQSQKSEESVDEKSDDKSQEKETRTYFVEYQNSPYRDVLESLKTEMESAENERERAEAKRVASLRQMFELSEENRSRITKAILVEKSQAEYVKEEYYKLHAMYADTTLRLKQVEDEAKALVQLNAFQNSNLQSAMEDLERATNLIKTMSKNEDILKSRVEQDSEKIRMLEEAVNRGVLAEVKLSQAVSEEQERVRQLMADIEEKRIRSANIDHELQMAKAKNADLKKALAGDRFLLQKLDAQLDKERRINVDMRRRFQLANLELVDLAVREEQKIRELEDSNEELAEAVLEEAAIIEQMQEQLDSQPVLLIQQKITERVPTSLPTPSSAPRDLEAEAVAQAQEPESEEPEFDLDKKSFKEALLEHTEQEPLIKSEQMDKHYGTDASTPNLIPDTAVSY